MKIISIIIGGVATLMGIGYIVGNILSGLAISAVSTILAGIFAGASLHLSTSRVTKLSRAFNLAFFLCLVLFWTTIFSHHHSVYWFSGNHWSPIIQDGDIFIKGPADQLDRGDTIIFLQDSSDYVAKILGLPHDELTLTDKDVFINGQIMVENYTGIWNQGESSIEYIDSVVSNQHYYILVEQQENSLASLHVGSIPENNVVNQVRHIYRPVEMKLIDRLRVLRGLLIPSLLAGIIIALYRFTSRKRYHKILVFLHLMILCLIIATYLFKEPYKDSSYFIAVSLGHYQNLTTMIHMLATKYIWLSLFVALAAYVYLRGLNPFLWYRLRKKQNDIRPKSEVQLSKDHAPISKKKRKATTEYRYWAFISYSTKDKRWAKWLHRSIERYGVPAHLVNHPTPVGEPAPKRFYPLFHDRSELPAADDLAAPIEKALSQSRYLIVVCSPNAAQSKWVNKEIEMFQKMKGSGRLLAVIVDGEPNSDNERECFPSALRQIEPIAADARLEGDGKRDAKLKLMAGMLGVGLDELKQRDQHRRIRRLQLVVTLSFFLVILFAGFAFYANQQREKAVSAREQAESILQYLLYDLRDKLKPIGRLDIVGDVQKQVDAYYQKLGIDWSYSNILYNRATAYENKGVRLFSEGDLSGALEAYEASNAIRKRLAADNPSNAYWQHTLATNHILIGDVLKAQGALPKALSTYESALVIYKHIANIDTTNSLYQHDLRLAQIKIGDVLKDQGKLLNALSAYRIALAISESLATADPNNNSWQKDLAVSQERIGDVLAEQGKLLDALSAYEASQTIIKDLAEDNPTDMTLLHDLSISYEQFGNILNKIGYLPEALTAYKKAIFIADSLVKIDPSNTKWQRYLSIYRIRIGNVLMEQNNLIKALVAYKKSLLILEHLTSVDSSNTVWKQDLSYIHQKIGDVQLFQGDLTSALEAYNESLAIREFLAAHDPSNVYSQTDLSVSHDKIGDLLKYQGNLEGALKAYQESLAITKQLTADDPSNALWQRDLAVSYYKLATFSEERSELEQAHTYWYQCYTILRHMRDSGMFLDQSLEDLLSWLEQKAFDE